MLFQFDAHDPFQRFLDPGERELKAHRNARATTLITGRVALMAVFGGDPARFAANHADAQALAAMTAHPVFGRSKRRLLDAVLLYLAALSLPPAILPRLAAGQLRLLAHMDDLSLRVVFARACAMKRWNTHQLRLVIAAAMARADGMAHPAARRDRVFRALVELQALDSNEMMRVVEALEEDGPLSGGAEPRVNGREDAARNRAGVGIPGGPAADGGAMSVEYEKDDHSGLNARLRDAHRRLFGPQVEFPAELLRAPRARRRETVRSWERAIARIEKLAARAARDGDGQDAREPPAAASGTHGSP